MNSCPPYWSRSEIATLAGRNPLGTPSENSVIFARALTCAKCQGRMRIIASYGVLYDDQHNSSQKGLNGKAARCRILC